MAIIVRLQSEIFDPGAESNLFLQTAHKKGAHNGTGAAVTFTGLVRSEVDDPIDSLTLEHFPALAQSQLLDMANQASARFDLQAITILHRFGKMLPNEPIVQVMALASHRQAAFDGASFVMDYLKTNAPFWKKEQRGDKTSWVEAKSDDDRARDRW